MYKVFYRDNTCKNKPNLSVAIAEFDDVIKACSLALHLHQVSNVSHSVYVFRGTSAIVTLETVSDDNKS